MATDILENPMGEKALLRYHEKLDGFRDTIEKYYSERTVDVYRTVMTNPPTDADLIPQRYKNAEDFNEELIIYTAEEIDEMTELEKREEVSGDAISVNTSLEKCILSARRTYRLVIEKKPERAEAFKKDRGPYIAKLSIRPEHGLVSASKNGHRNFLLRESVHIEDIWNTDFEVMSFDYDAEPDKKDE